MMASKVYHRFGLLIQAQLAWGLGLGINYWPEARSVFIVLGPVVLVFTHAG